MINPSFDEIKKVNNSRYAIAMIISKRARKIQEGSKPLIDSKGKKPVTIALDELMAGKIDFEMDENSLDAKK
ncbi:DNA-directed RNA polymerase subunit omega [Citroniella saccharovorans]|uniref:DNA-directed RNA polymerase subunit omega n=1 Tax=Citroniella saccharovorans TaxID=2053367 RepID=A0AAW9MV84_9FIRM|nr:DNA-directed RNA polymerase subunit omega [Citroniella saccharovorans]MEB3429504.1 DNA-directed RNA polymerase subunit omega [Citroniella saccharovorans]